jgi:hypothetical protein
MAVEYGVLTVLTHDTKEVVVEVNSGRRGEDEASAVQVAT